MAVGKDRKAQILQAALQREEQVAIQALDDAMDTSQDVRTVDPAADAAMLMARIQGAVGYLADVRELLTNVQNPTEPVA